jgi:hypothetical protein
VGHFQYEEDFMPDNYCDPIETCPDLDGQLLIEQTLHGPPLAVSEGLDIGDLNANVALRPYFRFRYSQRWNTKELCRGPIRSVLGLGPSETMTLETRQVEQVDFVRLVQETTERSEVVSTSGPAALMENGIGTAIQSAAYLILPTITARRFGSFLEDLGETLGGVVGGPLGAAVGGWAGDAIDGWIGGDGGGGDGTGNGATQDAVDQVLESVTRSQSERVLTETTTSRSSLFERTVQRTFTNPYKRRSLQLRFIPVFRHFDVVTVFFEFEHGLVANVHAPTFAGGQLSARIGDFVQRHVTDPRIVAVSSAELGIPDSPTNDVRAAAGEAGTLLATHLNANNDFYAKRYIKHLEARRDLAKLRAPVLSVLEARESGGIDAQATSMDDIRGALRWSKTRVQGRSIYTPFAPPEIVSKALPGTPNRYRDSIHRLDQFRLKRVETHRDVHLFAGTIIEPAPGDCTLPKVSTK